MSADSFLATQVVLKHSSNTKLDWISHCSNTMIFVCFNLVLDFGDNLQSPPMVEQPSLPLERTLVGDEEEEEEDEIVINHHDTASNLHGEDIPFSSELSITGNLTPLINRNTVVQLEEERPDTGKREHKSDIL